eukprot:scaffold5523_cov112-Isochrysis_galbana.AAC.2
MAVAARERRAVLRMVSAMPKCSAIPAAAASRRHSTLGAAQRARGAASSSVATAAAPASRSPSPPSSACASRAAGRGDGRSQRPRAGRIRPLCPTSVSVDGEQLQRDAERGEAPLAVGGRRGQQGGVQKQQVEVAIQYVDERSGAHADREVQPPGERAAPPDAQPEGDGSACFEHD